MNSTATSIRVNIVDGGLQPLPPTSNVLVHVRQGATDTIPPQSIKGGAALLVNDLEFHDNFMDTYTVIAYADGYQQAGTFVAVKRDRENPITLMLVKGNATFRFQSWDDLKRDDLEAVGFLVCEGDEASARANYERVAREHPEVLASDRKSTRLNSSHRCISYAVFCLKKKNRAQHLTAARPRPLARASHAV